MSERGRKYQSDILAILRRGSAPQSAYDVLGELRQSHPKLAPPTIYRALASLMERGLVHRLESLNAFVACQCGEHQHSSILSICEDCGKVEESVVPDLLSVLTNCVSASGFRPRRHVIELHGVCASCGDVRVPA
ncbi:MAG: Fur family transcriptional regulator [Pseudomonadota bacterium]